MGVLGSCYSGKLCPFALFAAEANKMKGGVATAACFLILKETSAAIILKRKAARLRKETGNESWIARTEIDQNLTPKQVSLSPFPRIDTNL